MQSLKSVAGALLLASTLSGCVAAVVPVVAGGAAARHRIKTSQTRQARRSVPVAPTTATQAQAQAKAQSGADRSASVSGQATASMPQPVAVAALPADPAQTQVGRIYQGRLPSPHAEATDQTGPNGAPTASATASWAALGRYVAGHLTPIDSVLLARGDQSHPRAVPCAGKPLAVLAPAALVTAAKAKADDRVWLDALHTLGVSLLTYGPGEKAGSTAGDLPAVATPADLPAMRASAGARYCVVALAGREPADFPNAWTSDTTPAAYRDRWGAGWFLFSAR